MYKKKSIPLHSHSLIQSFYFLTEKHSLRKPVLLTMIDFFCANCKVFFQAPIPPLNICFHLVITGILNRGDPIQYRKHDPCVSKE